MNDFRAVVQTHLEKNRLIPDASLPLIIGLSGGADSVALLHVLVDLGYTCRPAHCNFQLRGEESERDEQFAMARAHALGLPIETIRFDTSQYAREHKLSIEMAARELRYRWFEELRLQHRAAHIAVGHHADDNIETVLLNLIRGTGLKGLTGMQAANGYVIRPLLGVNRQDILEYLQQERLPFIEDSSNAASDYTRNKIRNELISLIETINPSFKASMMNTLMYLNGAYQLQNEYIQGIKSQIVIQEDTTARINCKTLRQSGGSITLLFELLRPYQFNSAQLHSIYNSLNSQAGKAFYSATHVLVKDRDFLLIKPLIETKKDHIQSISVHIFDREKTFKPSSTSHIVHLDADELVLPLKIRTWQQGDTFYPLGMMHRKKISDFLIDKKIDRLQKETIQVVTDSSVNQPIIWVAGYRIDHRYRIKDSTTRIAELTLKPKSCPE